MKSLTPGKITMSYRIRPARETDIKALEALFATAREFMARTGNPLQWGSTHPPLSALEEDIALARGYCVVDEGDTVLGYYALVSHEKTYDVMVEGKWLDDGPYVCPHRVATYSGQGVGRFLIGYLKEHYASIRIDTMDVNIPMRSLLEKSGFVYTGVIELEDHRGLRVAYQYLQKAGV